MVTVFTKEGTQWAVFALSVLLSLAVVIPAHFDTETEKIVSVEELSGSEKPVFLVFLQSKDSNHPEHGLE